MSIDHANESSSQQTAGTDERLVSPAPRSAEPALDSAAHDSGAETVESTVDAGSIDHPATASRTDTRRGGSSSLAEPIEFRIFRQGTPTRRLRLTGQRYTFGSGEGCSIRLKDIALRPTHAVLIRDQSRTLIRAYSVPIEINGVRTTEAELEPGDVVRLGPYRMELLSTTNADRSANAAASKDPLAGFDPWRTSGGRPDPFGPSVRGRQDSSLLEESLTDDWVRQGRSAEEELAWRKRLRQEVEQWRRRQSDCDQREYRCDQREADLRERESELWNRAESLYRREYRLQSQEVAASQLYDEFDKRQKELLRMREETRGRDEKIRAREAEFQKQETEYLRQLDEAQRQLVQSQQQASTAATAVDQMRQDFAGLREQISQLSRRQQQMDQRDQLQREEHSRLQQELEHARSQVEDKASTADSEKESAESKRAAAEARVEELTAQLDSLRHSEAEDRDQQQSELEAKEQLVVDLRAQVDQLQASLQNAQTESNQLRKDYELACQSVLQLESLVQQSTARGDQDRESWTAEAEQLRASIDQLSIQLAQANGELSELTKTNQELTAQLEQLQSEREQLHSERDQLQQEIQARPSNEAFAKLQHDLEETNKQFSQMLADYQATQEHLEAAEARIRAAENETEMASTAEPASPLLDPPKLDPPKLDPHELDQSKLENPELENQAYQQVDDQSSRIDQSDGSPMDDESFAPDVSRDAAGHDTNENDDLSLWPETETELSDGIAPASKEDAIEEFGWDSFEEAASVEPSATVDAGELPATSPTGEHLDDTPEATQEPTLASQLIEQLSSEPTEDLAAEQPTAEASATDPWTGQELMPEEPKMPEEPGQANADAPLSWDVEYDQESMLGPWPDDEDYRTDSEDYLTTEPTEVHDLGQWSDPNEPWSEDDEGLTPSAADDIASSEQEPSDATSSPDSEPSSESGESDGESLDPDDDDSIEAYMNRLLQRVQTGSENSPESTPSSSPKTEAIENRLGDVESTEVDGEDATTSEVLGEDQIAKAVPVDHDEPYLPRRSAPELSRDLTAMRKLANESADEAISYSVRTQTRDTQVKGMLSFGCAAGALLCGAACFHFIPGVVRYVAVAMTFIVAAVYVREGLQAMLEAQRRLRLAVAKRENAEQEPSEKAEVDPSHA